jgi:CheY-like chemotaxis protein
MLVEDSRFFRKTCKSEIENGGYNLIEAPGGPESLSIMKDHNINLIILDVEMPRMSGLETCEKIRNLENKNEENISIIFFTSKDTTKIEKEVLN